jgi:hypothetical protein
MWIGLVYMYLVGSRPFARFKLAPKIATAKKGMGVGYILAITQSSLIKLMPRRGAREPEINIIIIPAHQESPYAKNRGQRVFWYLFALKAGMNCCAAFILYMD